MTTTTTPGRRRGRAIATTLAAVVLMLLLGTGIADASTVSVHAIENPFGGVAPDLGVFGPALNATWKRLLAALWGAALAFTGARALIGGMKVRRAKARGYATDMTEGAEDFQSAMVSLGIVAAISPIVGAVLFIVGN